MSETLARARMLTVVSAVPNVGVVNDYTRFHSDWSQYLAMFSTTIDGIEQIRGCTISMNAIHVPKHEFKRGIRREMRFQVRCYMGWNDESQTEKTFAGLVEKIMNALDDDNVLHSSTFTGSAWEGEAATCDLMEPRTFGQVLCHYAEINQSLYEIRIKGA